MDAVRSLTSVRPSVGREQRQPLVRQAVAVLDDRDGRAGRAAASARRPPPSAFSRAMTAANDEIDWNWLTISENAPRSWAKAIADWVTTPNSTSPRMNSGATIRAGMIWIR